MLITARKVGEGIVINDNIRVVVVEIRHDKVRLGVEAPKEIPIRLQKAKDTPPARDV